MDKGSELNTTKANRFFNQEKKDSLKKFISIPLHDYKKSACTRSIPRIQEGPEYVLFRYPHFSWGEGDE